MVGVMGLAAGLVIGALLPRTRQEDRAFGRWADEVREQGMRYARDATQRGREYVEEALGGGEDRKSTRLNSSHANNSYAVFCLTKDLNSSMVLECSSELTITCIAEALGLSTGLTSSREIGKA